MVNMDKYMPQTGKDRENNECRHLLFSRTFPPFRQILPPYRPQADEINSIYKALQNIKEG